MFGYTSGEMIGETIFKNIPPEKLEEEQQILFRLKMVSGWSTLRPNG
jgi:hypothetical protein